MVQQIKILLFTRAPGVAQSKSELHLRTWVENFLLPALPKNSTIIWDNASFHKSQELRDILEEAGHTMIFLPPYSPDLNPIEHKWHELKQRLRNCYDESIDFAANLCREIRVMSMFERV